MRTFGQLLVRGLIVGLFAGLLAGTFAYVLGESRVDAAIAIEEAGAAHSHDHDSHDASHGSVKSYAIGFILSVILTLIPFGLVMYPTLPKSITLISGEPSLRAVRNRFEGLRSR